MITVRTQTRREFPRRVVSEAVRFVTSLCLRRVPCAKLQSRYIQHVLKITNGRITGNRGALRILGMKRSTLYLRLKQYNIRF